SAREVDAPADAGVVALVPALERAPALPASLLRRAPIARGGRRAAGPERERNVEPDIVPPPFGVRVVLELLCRIEPAYSERGDQLLGMARQVRGVIVPAQAEPLLPLQTPPPPLPP